MPKIPYPLRLDEDKVIKPIKEIAEKEKLKPAVLINVILEKYIDQYNKKK